MPEISVLIPAYNVERYVARCLDSVIGQTFEDLEIIIVEDGSTDGTPAILEEYAARDNRIRLLYHSGNCGLLWVRKTCIEASSGKYLMFVDSDDEVTPDACEKLHSEAVRTGADLVVGEHDFIMIDGRVSAKGNELKYGGSSYGVAMAMAMDDLNRYMWGKLFSRELFTDHPVTFLKHLNAGEDQIISWQIARYVKKAVCIPHRIYKYYQNTSSIIFNFRSDKDMKDFLTTSRITIDMAEQIAPEIKVRTETNAMRTFFDWIKKAGLGRKRVMALVEEFGFGRLFAFPSLVGHFGLKKALLYYAVTRFDFVPWLLYRKRWKRAHA